MKSIYPVTHLTTYPPPLALTANHTIIIVSLHLLTETHSIDRLPIHS